MRRSAALPLVLSVALALGACSSSGGQSTPAPIDPEVTIDPGTGGGDVAGTGNGNGSVLPSAARTALPKLSALSVSFTRKSGAFDSPVQVTSAADGSGRLFVVERDGRIRVYLGGGKVQKKAYLNIRSRVSDAGGEAGMLGLAFRKNFGSKHRVYVAYVANNGSLQISRFAAASKKARTVRASTERKILNVPHPTYGNHNGGSIAFGNDGYLYIGTGDGGGGGDPDNNAQNASRLLGKILRIDVTRSCGSKNYCVPNSNPFAGSSTARGEVWALGMRNPWRFSFDQRTGDLWVGDVGQNAYEEIDRIPAGAGGRNYGWPCREGNHVYDASRCKAGVKYRAPIEEYSHAQGASVIGGQVYRGSKYRSVLAGRYVYADFVSGRVWVRGSKGAVKRVATLDLVTAFGTGSSGEIWAVTLDGGLYSLKAGRR